MFVFGIEISQELTIRGEKSMGQLITQIKKERPRDRSGCSMALDSGITRIKWLLCLGRMAGRGLGVAC